MKFKTRITKTDSIIALGCILLLLANIGAVGRSGRRRAKEMVCVSNLHKWGMLFDTYTKNNNGCFMSRDDARWLFNNLMEESPQSTIQELFFCPEAIKPYHHGGTNPHMAWDYNEVRGSYCINLWISKEIGDGKTGTGKQEFWITPHVSGADRVPVFADGQLKDADPLVTDVPPELETNIWVPNQWEMQRVCVNRHNGAVNMLFLDWSVRKVGLKHNWRIPWHRTFDLEAPLPQWPIWMENFKEP